jgi:hypothetical protein
MVISQTYVSSLTQKSTYFLNKEKLTQNVKKSTFTGNILVPV